ncbi:MAG: LysR family transcriptional regulator, partial [Paracoccaceae bacterium]
MGVENWDEIRTAYQVARLGTVSAAAAALGVHHATVIRHVDALETRLGVKLFQRHARGYKATEAGEDLLKVASATDDQLTQLVSRIKGRSNVVTGELVITTVTGFATMLAPILAKFQAEHPDIKIRLLSDNRVFRLEYGEAHIALRAGPEPQEPDNVVQFLSHLSPVLYASSGYAARFGVPKTLADFAEHRFVGVENEAVRVPFAKWLRKYAPEQNFVFT